MNHPKTNSLHHIQRRSRVASNATGISLILLTLLSIGTVAGITGCQSLRTEAVSDDGQQVQSGIGLLYYLPKGRVHIVGGFAASNTSKSGSSNQDNPNPQQSAGADANGRPKKTTPDPTAVTPTDLIQTASTNIPPRPTSPSGDNSGDSKSDTGLDPRTYSITISGDLIADETRNYRLNPRHDYMADDATHLGVNAKGLLSTSSATNKDDTVDIVSDAISMALAFGGTNGKAKLPTLIPFDIYFDPENSGEVQSAREKIRLATNERLDVVCTPPTAKPDFTLPTQQDGILYRRLIPYHVTVSGDLGTGSRINADQYVLLPDKKTLFSVDSNRMPFAQKVTSVTFTDGVPVEYSESVPSPVLGFIGIPKAIIQAILPIPTTPTAATGVASKSSSTGGKN